MTSMIDRYQLRYFLAVVDAGNFSRAASRLNVTQPTLSIGVAKLEEHVGARLFFRNSQRVHLTESGARFLPHARLIESEFNLLETHVPAAPAPVVRLGVITTIPTRIIEEIVTANRRSLRPDRLEIVEGAERDLLSRLQRRRVDLALTILRPGEARFPAEPLLEEGYALALPEWHRLAHVEAIESEDLAEEVMIVRRHCEVLGETSRHFTDRGVRPRFSFRTTNDDKAAAMVRAGLGITVMPDSYLEPGLARPRLAGFDFRREIGVLHADGALMEAASPVVEVIREVVRQEMRPG